MSKISHLLIPSLLLCFSSVGASAVTTNTITSFSTTPLYNDGSKTNMQIQAVGTNANITKVEVYIINDLYPDGISIYSASFSSKSSKNFSYDNSYTRPNNSIKISWHGKLATSEKSVTKAIPVIDGTTYSINKQLYTNTSRGKIYTFSNGSWTETSQTLKFTNFEDIYMPDYYHKLDLSIFKIKYNLSFPATMSCKRATLSISDKDNKFKNFSHTYGVFQIELKLTKSNQNYTLGLSNKLYVNQTTLEMSPVSKSGFVATDYFYFPRNEKRNEGNYKCHINLDGIGIDHSTFQSSFSYKSILNIMGDCRNSEYCITFE